MPAYSREWQEYGSACLGVGILTAASRCNFTSFLGVLGEMSESRAKRVRIKEVDGWTLRMLIDYVYTAEIQVTEENVQVKADALLCSVLDVCSFSNPKPHSHMAYSSCQK